MTAISDNVQEGRVIIEAPGRRIAFQGYLVREGDSRLEDNDRLRYTVMRIYKVTNEELPFQYVLSTLGRSVVYHRHAGPCRTGTAATYRDLELLPYFDQLQECHRCRPKAVEDLHDDELVDRETDRINPIKKCATARDLWDRFHETREERDPKTRLLKPVRYLSAPAERLLRQAAEVDPLIREAVERVDELSADDED